MSARISLDGTCPVASGPSEETLADVSLIRLKSLGGSYDSLTIPLEEDKTTRPFAYTLHDESQTQLLSGTKLVLAIIALDILMFISALDATIVATTYVPIGNALDSLGSAEWIISSYLIAMAASQPLYGAISDLLGRVETIVAAILIFTIGSVLCAVSPSMPMLIASRAIQGVGGGGLLSLALIVIADIMNERQRGKYVSIFSGTYGIASAIAPAIGGAIVQYSKWQIIFWINIPLCIIALTMVVTLLRIPRPHGSMKEKLMRIDFGGALLCIAGVVLLLLGLAWGGRGHAWASAQVLCTLCFGILVLVLFVVYEWKVATHPIIPIRLFRMRNVIFASVCSLLFGFAINGAIMFIPQMAQIVYGASPSVSGAYLAPYCGGMVLTSILSGVLIVKTGHCRVLIVAGAGLMLLGNGLLIILGPEGALEKAIGFLLLGGLGVGACIQTIGLVGQASVRGKDMATLTATVSFFRSMGMVLAVSVLSNIIQNVLRTKTDSAIAQFPDHAASIGSVLNNWTLLHSSGFPQPVVDAFIAAYGHALRCGFIALAAFTGLFFILSFGFKHVELKEILKKTIDV
ncbi:hypothetical protein GGF46_001160 [Coemansia sp. RSA 552]|nr:hypothetical protein GGF46_001160 [Coemansia sp. RSA 552]